MAVLMRYRRISCELLTIAWRRRRMPMWCVGSTGKGRMSAEVLQALSVEALRALRKLLHSRAHFLHRSPITRAHIQLFILPKYVSPQRLVEAISGWGRASDSAAGGQAFGSAMDRGLLFDFEAY